jgi:hypothetical protein
MSQKSKKAARAAYDEEQEAAIAKLDTEQKFIGGMPGGRIWNPYTQSYRGYSSDSLRKTVPIEGPGGADLYGIDNVLPATTDKFAQYVEGDEWKPGGKDYTTIQNLQYKLYQNNLYDSEAEFRVGEWDEADADAYRRALTAANANFMTVEEWLEAATANPTMRIQAKKARKPLVVTVTDPDDLKAIARSSASTLFGRNVQIPDEFMDQMIAGYQQLQRDRAIENYNLEEIGGETVGVPTEQAYIQRQIQERYPSATQDDEFSTAMDSVMAGLFGGE